MRALLHLLHHVARLLPVLRNSLRRGLCLGVGHGVRLGFLPAALPTIFFCICVLLGGSLGASPGFAQEENKEAENSTAAQAPKRIQLFGTVEFKGSLKTLTQWQNAMKEHADNPLFVPGATLNSSTTWDSLKASLTKLPPLEQIKAVNSFWNKWPYRQDKDVYGAEDYWAAPHIFRKKSGDCEDYCIAKYFTLRELGFSADQLRIVIVIEKIRNIAHAVLAVYINDDAYILDNLTSSVLSHTKSRNYEPQYSVNEHYRWAHVRPKSPKK